MVFSSFFFIYLFLPVSTLLYYCTPRSLRNYVLLAMSALFYTWGAPTMVPLVLVSCYVDYYVSLRLNSMPKAQPGRRALLALTVTMNLLLLAYFKYANFFIEQTNALLSYIGASPLSWASVALPIGISFFTFQKISYLVDVYRGGILPTRSASDYLLYILFFPQLIAGPIVRYHDVAALLVNRRESSEMFFEGCVRFSLGLGKKILIADQMGMVADTIFGMPSSQLTTSTAWLGTICYSLQIYFDFSGYSDMAIGLAKIFGFTFAENFNSPYRSQNFSEFWRRWHISLSSWMKEYLYVPLGGNRYSSVRTYCNLWIVFLLSGLWHGAQWTFVLWGAYHGVFLVLDRVLWIKVSQRLPTIINIALTFILVSLGWVLFRAESISHALLFYAKLIGYQELVQPPLLARAEIIHNRGIVVFAAALTLVFIPGITSSSLGGLIRSHPLLSGSYALVVLLLATAAMVASGFTPFLYFRF